MTVDVIVESMVRTGINPDVVVGKFAKLVVVHAEKLSLLGSAEM